MMNSKLTFKYWKGLFIMKKLEVAIEKVDGRDVLRLSGPVYEGSARALLPFKDAVGDKVTVNFRNVTTTNTCGIAEWMEFLQEFSQGREIVFDECPPVIVMLINMIPFFRRGAKIRSIYRSYFCADCNKEHWDFMVAGENMPKKGDALDKLDDNVECLCRECGKQVFPEVPADEFFGFLQMED